jgi:hypothetical protein
MGVVFTENDKVVIDEAPLDDAIKSADDVYPRDLVRSPYMYFILVFQCRYISLLTRYHFNVLKGEVTDKTPILKVSEVVNKKSLVGSRT